MQLADVLSAQSKVFYEEGFVPTIDDIEITIEEPSIDVFTPEEGAFVDFKRAAIGIKIDGNNGRYRQNEIVNNSDFTPLKYFGLDDWVKLPEKWRYTFYETINNMIDAAPFLVLFLYDIGQYYWQWINDSNGIKSEIIDIISSGNSRISQCDNLRSTMCQILEIHKEDSIYTDNIADEFRNTAIKRGMLRCASGMKKIVAGWKIGNTVKANDWFFDNFGVFDTSSEVITYPYAQFYGLLNTVGELVTEGDLVL